MLLFQKRQVPKKQSKQNVSAEQAEPYTPTEEAGEILF